MSFESFLCVAMLSLSQDAGTPPPAVKSSVSADAKDLVNRVQAFYERIQDFTASFQQNYTYKTLKRTQVSSGTVTFKKPAHMRWDYEKPSKKTFVLAEDKVYTYDPEAMTLTKASMGSNPLSASVTFLWGRGRLADEFSIRKVACETCKGVLLELTPLKADPRFKMIRLEADPKSGQVLKTTVVDPDGSENVIAFVDLKTNQGAKLEDFKIAAPAGTKMMDYTQP